MTGQESPKKPFPRNKALFTLVLVLGVVWGLACVVGYVNPLVAVGSIVAFGCVALAAVFARDRWRFTLRSLLIAVFLVGAVLAFRNQCLAPYLRQEEAIAELKKLGRPIITASDDGPEWLRFVVGKDRFLSVNVVGNVPMGMEHPLRESKLDDEDLKHCVALRGLERLILEKTQVTDAGLARLRQMSSLTYLSLSQTELSDQGTEHLRHLTKLGSIRTKDTQLGDGTLASLGKLHNLGDVELGGARMTDDGLRHLKELNNLGELYIVGTRITGEGLVHLSDLPRLNKVCLRGAHVDNEGMRGVASLRRATELQLAGPSLDGNGLNHLAAIPNISELFVCTNATLGRSLSNLQDLRNLRVLGLDCQDFDAQGLEELQNLTHLEKLFLRTMGNLSSEQVARLQNALSATEVIANPDDGRSWHRQELDEALSKLH